MSLGAGGDRWHSGCPNHSDTTQGAAVADCRGEQRADRLCLSHKHKHTFTHTYVEFSLVIFIRFVTNLSNNLQSTAQLPESVCARYMYPHVLPADRCTCTRASMHLRRRSTHIRGQKHTHTHSRTEPSLCSAGERVGPQQGPPVLSWSPPVWPRATLCSQAAHHSLHTANRLRTWRES